MRKIILVLVLIILITGCVQELEELNLEVEEVQEEVEEEVKHRAVIDPEFLEIFEPKDPACDGQKFTVPLVDLDEIYDITPLGNLNPPEHTLPTDHMYFHLNSNAVELKAPGDIRITSISSSTNNELGTKDYSLDFAFCDEINGYFIHIKTLEPELEALLENCQSNVYGDGKYESCWAGVDYSIKAGTLIGTVGNENQANFDFGAFDYNNPLLFVNPDRYYEGSKSLHITCPLDLYEEEIRNELYLKVDRSINPVCGETMQDIPATLQGNWYYGEGFEWNEHLTFGYDNFDPSLSVISIGGVFTDANRWSFTSEDSGFINREFDQVTSDGNIYCYEEDGKILVQMVSETEISIEYQTGSCSGSYSFNTPTTYER